MRGTGFLEGGVFSETIDKFVIMQTGRRSDPKDEKAQSN